MHCIHHHQNKISSTMDPLLNNTNDIIHSTPAFTINNQPGIIIFWSERYSKVRDWLWMDIFVINIDSSIANNKNLSHNHVTSCNPAYRCRPPLSSSPQPSWLWYYMGPLLIHSHHTHSHPFWGPFWINLPRVRVQQWGHNAWSSRARSHSSAPSIQFVPGSSFFLEVSSSFWYRGVPDGTLRVERSRLCRLFWGLVLPSVSPGILELLWVPILSYFSFNAHLFSRVLCYYLNQQFLVTSAWR